MLMTKPAKKTTERNCEFCGEKIPQARLQALPATTACVRCADKHPQPLDPRIVADVQEGIDCIELDPDG